MENIIDQASYDRLDELAEDLLDSITRLISEYRRVCGIAGVVGIPTTDIEE